MTRSALLKSLGISDQQAKALVAALAPKAAASPKRSAKPKWRVGCSYGACKATFLPHGVGAAQHTTCEQGLAAMKAARS